MNEDLSKSWFSIDGRLEKIKFTGENDFRYPKRLAEIVIKKYSRRGDWILDPFAGFGTTLKTAQILGRKAMGFELDKERADFAAIGLKKPTRIIYDRIENLNKYKLPKFDLVFTSPPYVTVNLKDDPWGENYFKDMKTIFTQIKKVLKPNATLVIEVSNIRTKDGIRPLAWQFGKLLSTIYQFQGEIIRCNESNALAGPGFNHSYLLIYKI
jgi:DNA modification methylase